MIFVSNRTLNPELLPLFLGHAQEARHFAIAAFGSQHGSGFVIALGIGIGALRQKLLHQFDVARLRGGVQRSISAFVRDIRIGAAIGQRGSGKAALVGHRYQQGLRAVGQGEVCVRAGSQQLLHRFRVVLDCREHQGREAALRCGVDIGLVVD